MCDCSSEDVKVAIEIKQAELNKLLEDEIIDKIKALELSVELDKLIYRYYSYKM
ncbi:aspartyl-phosphate phosphatase Spo0E family protein [Proteiniborus sp. MB09-C3]|uniref:aspartyl-phosphate phosphatase Spo0E family protein n=1 Tax=Proteiniborus sp. MB09-C3 TaxID=3050072 RepID=UPI002554A9E7|nr:aspartyl-phosphate phosphatase Spo0E family protein [Proteiniborus sp. MB09-C3]WIV11736.1 aspartyl-phosphate phosphatase Spo0E family protein [Proteiniborus sp. MB09-C3]